jgi:predicted NAD-dependent protein-ADP-ribosyltransferase YbiA (DUF1768 family)
MKISRLSNKKTDYPFVIEFFDDEIDQLLTFAAAVRSLRPDWLNNKVFIRGTNPRTGRKLSYKNCSLISAFSWGYLRTLIAHDQNKREITIGGGNAVMEDLAVDVIQFRSRDGWLTTRRTVNELILDSLGSDYEEQIWKHEFVPSRGNDAAVVKELSDIKENIDSDNSVNAQHAACTIFPRLKSIPRLCDNKIRKIEDFLEKPIDMARKGREAFLQMHVCESIFWLDIYKLRKEIRGKVAAVLMECVRSDDINVKLAAIISAAKHGLLSEIEFSGELISLGDAVSAGNHPYLRQVRATCETLIKRTGLYHLSPENKNTIKTLLPKISEHPQSAKQWGSFLQKVKSASTADDKKKSFESLTKAILNSIPSVENVTKNYRSLTSELDLIFRFKKEDPSDFFENTSDNMFAVECKNWKTPMDAKAVRDFLGKMQAMKITKGIIVSKSGITGKPGRDAYGVLQQHWHQFGIKVVVLTLVDIEKLRKGDSLAKMLTDKSFQAQSGMFK